MPSLLLATSVLRRPMLVMGLLVAFTNSLGKRQGSVHLGFLHPTIARLSSQHRRSLVVLQGQCFINVAFTITHFYYPIQRILLVVFSASVSDDALVQGYSCLILCHELHQLMRIR